MTDILKHVPVQAMDPWRFEPLLDQAEDERWLKVMDVGAHGLEGRVIWNVNSTARGGGVAELLRPLLGYARGAGVDARWVVIRAERDFFTVTKRLHNHLHGFKGDGGALGAREHAIYQRTLTESAEELALLLRPQDIVILHDPQTAGMARVLRETGALVIWRCHVGRDHANACAREAWHFLRQYVLDADAFVFSRTAFAWEGLPVERVRVIQPSIDPFSPKNAEQEPEQTLAILARAAIVPDHVREATFTRFDGTPGRVDRPATMIEEQPLSAGDRLVTQISRWDHLKDPIGVLDAFAQTISAVPGVHLLLAGPAVEGVADDPEGPQMLAEVHAAWQTLSIDIRRRVHVASLPMYDAEENAAVVNAIQRHSEVLVQKSLAEGFGLTVTEAMWKRKPVVASATGGIQDQIVDGVSGILIKRPRDLPRFGAGVIKLLKDRERACEIGLAARERVRSRFLGPSELNRYLELFEDLSPAISAEDQTVSGTISIAPQGHSETQIPQPLQ